MVTFGYAVRTSIITTFQEGSCHMISISVAEHIEAGEVVTQEMLDDTVTTLIRASVIAGRMDDAGNPTDYNGKPFDIQVTDDMVTTSTSRAVFHPFKAEASWEIGK